MAEVGQGENAPTCPECGRPLDSHDRNVRFRLPDPVLATEEQSSAPGVWMSHNDPNNSVLMQVPHVGAFVRCTLPISLTGGYTVTFGVWLAVHPDDLQRAARIWWEPEYQDLELDGHLANDLPLWGLLASPARAKVIDPDATPVVLGSDDSRLVDLLSEEHPHEELLAVLPN